MLLIQEDLDRKDRWLLRNLMDWESDEGTILEIWEEGHRKELTKMLKEQAGKA